MKPKLPTLILAFKHTARTEQFLREHFEVIQNASGSMTVDEIITQATAHHANALMVSVNHGLRGEKMRALPASVKVIATSSVGYDHLDRDLANELGISLTHTPGVLSDATADLAMTLLLNVSRRTREYLRVMDEGWPRMFGQSEMLGVSLQGKTLGIFGMGSIGQKLAQRARAFGMRILYCNRAPLSAEKAQNAEYYSKFEAMLPHCDFLSLNAPATAETASILNSKTFALLKKGAILINVARGSLIDEDALIETLRAGHLRGAGLDVFQNEPGTHSALFQMPQVFATPHMGSATEETRDAMGLLAAQNILAVLAGKRAITPVPD